MVRHLTITVLTIGAATGFGVESTIGSKLEHRMARQRTMHDLVVDAPRNCNGSGMRVSFRSASTGAICAEPSPGTSTFEQGQD